MVTNRKEYMREYLKKYRQSPKFKEYRMVYMRRKYSQSPKYREYIKEYNKKYYQSHRQQILERQKKYQQYLKKYHQSAEFKERIKEYYRKYYQTHPERQRYGLSHYPADVQMQYLDFLWDQVKKEVKKVKKETT